MALPELLTPAISIVGALVVGVLAAATLAAARARPQPVPVPVRRQQPRRR